MTTPQSERGCVGKKVALGVTGGIAAYKAIEVLRGLQRAGCEVRVGMTARACEFVQPLTFRALSGSHVVVDDYAPDNPDPIAHITFSQTVDLFIVAPATANAIAKFANGVADDFLTSTYLASTAPVLIAPAMNTSMWEHPATQRNLKRLKEDGVQVIEPDDGEMACGTIGPGRLSEPDRIVTAALEILSGSMVKDLAGEKFLITVGATREAIDPVRFISNRSSGKMGFAIAQAAVQRGATVAVVAGITTAEPPRNTKQIKVSTADEMYRAVMDEIDNATVFIGAAAVADYKPAQPKQSKLKKTEETLLLTLERTRDILGDVSATRREGLLIIGFAAETENILEHANEKLRRKNLDAIVANDVSRADAGFESDNNAITIISPGSNPVEIGLTSKLQAAHKILDEIVALRQRRTSRSMATQNA